MRYLLRDISLLSSPSLHCQACLSLHRQICLKLKVPQFLHGPIRRELHSRSSYGLHYEMATSLLWRCLIISFHFLFFFLVVWVCVCVFFRLWLPCQIKHIHISNAFRNKLSVSSRSVNFYWFKYSGRYVADCVVHKHLCLLIKGNKMNESSYYHSTASVSF